MHQLSARTPRAAAAPHARAGGHPVQWKIYARNKKSVRMNLRDDRAKELLLKMVETADVFIENFRVGGLEKILAHR